MTFKIGQRYFMKNCDSEPIDLGKFIEYIGIPWVGDWLYDGRARFENKIVDKNQYEKIYESEQLCELS
jgi:hypothetical protein